MEPELTEEEKQKIQTEFSDLVKAFQQDVMAVKKEVTETPRIVYGMAIYEERMPQVLTCLKRVRPYVDDCIIVVDGSMTKESFELLKQWGCKIVYRDWDNHFSKQRNSYLGEVNEGEWVLVSDPDELFSESLMLDLKKIVLEAEKREVNIFGINSHDITTELDGRITETVSDWFKQLLFKNEEGVRYVGCVHETLLPGVHGWRAAELDKRYYCEHYKSMIEVKERGARNVFCGGGGNNVLNRNPMYVELHTWAGGVFESWPNLRDFVRHHNSETYNPQTLRERWPTLKEIIVRHRNDSGWDWENESRDFFLWCKALFPDEFKEWESTPQQPSVGSPPEIMAYVEEQYLKILGRNADDQGKQRYMQAIMNGAIKREDLPKILMQSEEYQKKHFPQRKEFTCTKCGTVTKETDYPWQDRHLYESLEGEGLCENCKRA